MAGKVKQLTFAEGVSITAPTEVDLVDTVNAQTVDGAKKFTSAITIAEIATPATPASGFKSVYPKSDGKMYTLDSTGAEVAVGTGGAGGRNYLADWYDGTKLVGTVTNSITATGNITISTTLWQASNTSFLTVANLTSGGLRETKGLKLDNIGAGAAFVQSPCFLLDTMDLGKPVTTTFDMSSVVASDDYQVVIVRYNSSGTYQEQIVIAGTASATTPFSARCLTGTANNQGFFISSSTSTDYYALRFVRNSASDTTDIPFDSLYVGPQSVVQGAAVTDWVSYTPSTPAAVTLGNGTITGTWRRVGDSIEVRNQLVFGTTTSMGAITVQNTLPNSLTLDTTKLIAGTQNIIGGAVSWDANADTYYTGGVRYDNTGNIYIFGTEPSTGIVTTTVPFTWTTSDKLQYEFTVPVATWSSSVTMANRAVEEYAYNTYTTDDNAGTSLTAFGYGAGGQVFGSFSTATRIRRVRFQTPILPTDLLTIECLDNNSNWVVNSFMTTTTGATTGIILYPGLGEATDVDVYFGSAGYSATPRTGVGSWGSIAGIQNYKWRVRKVSGGASVGFPVGARNIVGDTTGTAVPTGYIGEKLTGTVSVGTFTYAGSALVVASLSVTTGVWMLVGNFNAYANAAPPATTAMGNSMEFYNSTDAASIAKWNYVHLNSNYPTVFPFDAQELYNLPATIYVSTGTKTIQMRLAGVTAFGTPTGATTTVRAASAGQGIFAVRIA